MHALLLAALLPVSAPVGLSYDAVPSSGGSSGGLCTAATTCTQDADLGAYNGVTTGYFKAPSFTFDAPGNIYSDDGSAVTWNPPATFASAAAFQAGAVCTGDISVSGQYYDSALTTSTPSGTTQAIDWASGNVQKIDLEDASGNVTLTFSNLKATGVYQLVIQQDGGGNNRTVTFPAAWQFSGGALNPYTLTVTATADERDLVSCVCESATYCLCNFLQNFTNP